MNLKLNYLFACLHSLWCADIIDKSQKERKMGMKKLIAAGAMLVFMGLYYVVGMGG